MSLLRGTISPWIVLSLIVLSSTKCGEAIQLEDTPANCTYEDAHGDWIFSVCDTENCSESSKKQVKFRLLYPNLVMDAYNNTGTWTMIYNQGFELLVEHRKWLVMFDYDEFGHSICDRSKFTWTHDTLLRQKKWFTARKVTQSRSPSVSSSHQSVVDLDQPFRLDTELIRRINTAKNSWIATEYPFLEHLTLRDVKRLTGGRKSVFSHVKSKSHPLSSSPELQKAASELPETFDWRFPPDGRRSPVTPIRSQLQCGSCYAFASAAALEARIRIRTNFEHEPILSPQDIVDCSAYSQGCDGGFPYLIAGKYAEDVGMALESCNPYKGKVSSTCTTRSNCTRYYATNYRYVGGYYGATNELLMKMELVHHGPFPVGFMVYDDFIHYKSGVYQHTHLKDSLNRFDPFELTNHAVLVVGYGGDRVSEIPYWIVKNSWGENWGEKGFFRIRRGNDECGIESLAVSMDPVL